LCSDTSVLSDDGFEHDGTSYTVNGLLSTSDDGAWLRFENAVSGDGQNLTLIANGRRFPFVNGMSAAGLNVREWRNARLGWTAGTAVTVSLTAPVAPGAPTGLTAAGLSASQIDLLWTAPSSDGGADLTGYKIEVSTDRTSWSDLEADTGSIGTTYSHTGLSAGQTRHYRVSAINYIGAGNASNVASGTTHTPAQPGLTFLPTTGNVREGSTTTYTVKLDAQPSDPVQDVASVSVVLTSRDTRAVTVSPSQLTFTAVTWNDEQTVTVTAVQDDDSQHETVTILHSGNGVNDGELTVNVTDDEASSTTPGSPTPPRNLEATGGNKEVLLSWMAPADDGGASIVRYEYRQKSRNGPFGGWQIITDRPGEDSHVNTRRHLVTGLRNGTTYTFELRAVNDNGAASRPSESASATPEETLSVPALPLVGQLALALLLAAGGLLRRQSRPEHETPPTR